MTFSILRRPMVLALGAAAFVFCLSAGEAHAQWSTKWLAVGKLHHPYLSGGAEPENLVDQMNWPGIRPGVANNHWKGLWVSARNVTDENGETWDVRTSHIGPRILGLGEFFDMSHILVARFEPPIVTVDGFETFQRPTTVDEVDPSLNPARMVVSEINTSVGVSITKRAMQWSTEEHESYHIVEYIFTNTGNVDDDEDVELPDQSLDDVYFTFLDRPKINAASGSWDNSSGGMAWGQHVMNDAVAPDMPHDYGVDFRAQYAWMGAIPDRSNEYNTLGNPMWKNHQWNSVADDTLGRLGGAYMYGIVTLHADTEAHGAVEYDAVYTGTGTQNDVSDDDPAQPHTMTYIESDWSDITTGNDHTNTTKMELERGLIERGATASKSSPIAVAPEGANPRTAPTHAQIVAGGTDFLNQKDDPSLGKAGGWGFMNAYGPYDMAPGEQVRIVVAEGVAGLNDHAAGVIGRAYRRSGANDDLVIPYDSNGDGEISEDEQLTKNEWVLTARDSLFQLFGQALANYEAGYDIPQAPLPPSRFDVTSGTDQIQLAWETYAGAYEGSDDPPNGWEVYRAQNAYNGIVTALRVEGGLAIPDSSRAYELIASLPGSARSYEDSDVARGVSYYYYIQAVGQENTDPTGSTPTGYLMKSNRYYSQTFEPAFLRRPPGEEENDIRIVPNPYNLGSTTDVRFPDKEDKLAFYGLPGIATIRIYTELGELVETIEHTDGSGDEFWFLTTSSRQLISSGIYIAVVENKDPDDDDFGQQTILKFIIIR